MAHKVIIVSAFNGWQSGHQLLPISVQTDPTDPHTKTQYLMDTSDNQLYESTLQTNKFQSFLVNNAVVSDGNYYVFTPMDVLFVVLPSLM
ncbi:unnamed protein product, partial [Medioppia subpectinata]